MSNTIIDPIYWSAQRIISYGPDTIHELALKAAGTLNSYHLVLGRCLLAVHRTKLYEKFGCSGAVHYGALVLGLRVQKARALRWVAQKLEALPVLSRAGERGEVGWSKLREVVRKASAETEGFWLELCRLKTYREIERLVRCTPRGAIPGDLPNDDEQEPAVTELRLRLGLAAEAIVTRGLQLYSLQQGRPVPLAEAVELLFSQLLQKGEVGGRSSAAEDLDDLAKSQKEARKDLLAAALGREPLVREARELAQAMGVIDSDSVTGPDSEASLPLQEIYSELMESSLQVARAGEAGSPARETRNDNPPEIDPSEFPAREIHADNEEFAKVLAAYQRACPGNEEVSMLARDLGNPRLRYNPEARQATPAQRRELLRRDGYCCATPGCPNHLWLNLHHVVFYSCKGRTISTNLVSLCSIYVTPQLCDAVG